MKPTTKTIRLPDGSTKIMWVTYVPKSLREFIAFWCANHAEPSKFTESRPCTNPECRGSGRVWHPDDDPDQIEGNRGRRRINCPTCKGTGIGDKKTFDLIWKSTKEKLLERQKNELTHAAKVQKALKRISVEDWKLIQSLQKKF